MTEEKRDPNIMQELDTKIAQILVNITKEYQGDDKIKLSTMYFNAIIPLLPKLTHEIQYQQIFMHLLFGIWGKDSHCCKLCMDSFAKNRKELLFDLFGFYQKIYTSVIEKRFVSEILKMVVNDPNLIDKVKIIDLRDQSSNSNDEKKEKKE